jgi:hypothetical protein
MAQKVLKRDLWLQYEVASRECYYVERVISFTQKIQHGFIGKKGINLEESQFTW